VLGVILVTYHLGFDLSVMASPSMSPTLRGTGADNGDWVLTERISYLFRSPRRWEVMAFRNAYGLKVMKRVIGLPGEEVTLRKGVLTIGGVPAARPASIAGLRYYAYGNLAAGQAAACEGGYYVLGDDSKDSEDSRYEGPVRKEQITGRAWVRLWPLRRVGAVNP
jgi:signal peptidase I